MTLSALAEQTLREPLDRPYDDGFRAGVDGRLMPVLAAPDVAISLVAAP
jgi:hypothetical protein